MDQYPEHGLVRHRPPMKTEEEVVNHILNPPANIDYQRNVTTALFELFHVFDGEKDALDLRSIKDNGERIKAFKGRWLDKLKNLLDKELLLTRGWIDLLTKKEAMADLLRRRGNEYFINRNFEMALRAYTLAGMYAPKGSKSLALSYSNRSACFAETNRWIKCLEDIKRFEEIWNKIEEGPTPTRDKVTKRKERCLKEIGDAKEKISIEKKFGNDFFKLKSPSAVLPSLESFLGVKSDPKRGRGIYNISDKAVEPGTVLILDNPYSHVNRNSFCFEIDNCSVCYKILDGSGIPCGGCVFNVYCSDTCATSDHRNLHEKYECKMAPFLFEVLPKDVSSTGTGLGSYAHLAFSVLLKLGPKALLDHYRQVFKKKGSKENDKDGSGVASYLPIYNLVYHEEILSEEKILEHCKYTIVLAEILDSCTDYFTCLNLDELEAKLFKEEFLRRLLLHRFSMALNSTAIAYLDLPRGRPPTPMELQHQKAVELGVGIYPVISLMNHSCAPNTRWIPLPGGVYAAMALEYIVPGQEIFATYRSHHLVEPTDQRLYFLKNFFGFKCECPACTQRWPLQPYLKSSGENGALGCVCPECRKKLGLFDKVNVEGSTRARVCPRKCGWKISKDDMEEIYNNTAELCNDALKSLGGNKILKGFMDAKKCVRFFDAHFPKPSQEIATTVEAMGTAIAITATRMFE